MTYYADSPYAHTRYVSGQKAAISADTLRLYASYTQGGTIPFTVRYQYSAKYIITAGTPSNPTYGGWGPLDETVDKINGTPGLKLMVNLAYLPHQWLAIDRNGNFVGYNAATAVLPDGPAMAIFAAKLAQRYGDLIQYYQIGNEEYDTALNGSVGGTILAPTFNYAAAAIAPYITNAKIITGSIRPLSHPNGNGTLQWMQNFYGYVPKSGEPPRALPYAHDFHLYDDSSHIATTNYPSPDPTTTDNSASPVNAIKPSVQGIVSIMQSVLNVSNPSAKIWNLENGYSLPNNSPNNHNSAPSDLPSQQSRYTRDVMAQLHYANVGGKYAVYSMLDNGNDPRALSGQSITDLTNYIIATPQWTGAAPTAYLYQSVDALSFEGDTTTKPADQYFSIMNPTGSSKAWSIASNQGWLTAVTLPTNGMKGTAGANLTSGTLAAGQCITLKCTADSTYSGLTTLSAQSGTLTVTIGSNVSTITVSLFATPSTANPNLTSASAGPGNGPTFTMTVNGSAPANQTITFKNQDSYATWWYAFNTANWFTINTASGNLAAGATQNITISMVSGVVSNLAPGTYTEVLTISAKPFPVQYTTDAPPTRTQFITVIVHLTVQTAHTPSVAVQVSASALQFTAVASGAVPAGQTFYLLNCTNATESWTATKTQSWLSLSPTSGSLPASGSTTGTSPNIQSTDYKVVTASINSTALSAGTYTDTITVTLGGSATQTIPVTYIVSGSGSTLTIGASPTSASLSQVQGGTAVTSTTTLTNSGNTTGTYSTALTYHQAQTGWLGISPTTASLTGSGGTQVVTFTCTPGTLAPGTYTATVTFTLGTSTATYNMTFTVTASASAAALALSPASLTFNDTIGSGDVPTQSLTLSNTGGLSGTWSAHVTYGTGANWIGLSLTTDTLAAGANEAIVVSMNDTALAVGTYTATITFSAGASSVSTNVTLIINPQISDPSAPMTSQDMTAEYQYILSTIVGPELRTLALTYYSGATTNQVIYGEIDALFPFEQMSQLHVMKTPNDVTAFLNAYAYVANVLSDEPAAYYRLGELSGIYAYDISGRNMTATISNILGVLTGVTLGQTGALPASTDTAMLFDGSTGNIILPAAVNTANWSALTVEAWINPSNVTFSYTAFVVANDAPNTSHVGFQLSITTSSVIFRIGTGSTSYQISQAYTFAAGTWYHLVGTFSGTALIAYVNGSQIATTPISTYLYKKAITIDHTKVSGGADLSNFPVLISMTDADLKTVGNGGKVQDGSGYDIVFMDSTETTQLDHEIEKYVASTGEIEMWVRIPTLSHMADTTIYLYFDNSGISTSQENVHGVWDSNFKGVYHLGNGSTLSVADSTSNANNGTNSGATATTGQIDGGANFNGTSASISIPNFALGSSTVTMTAWVNYSSTSGNMIIEKKVVNQAWELFFESGILRLRGNNTSNTLTATPPASGWHRFTGVITGTTGTILIDGVQVANGTVDPVSDVGTNPLYIGAGVDFSAYYYSGIIDEVRISNTNRSNGWDATEYANQNSPSTFYAVGSLTSRPGGSSSLIAQTTNSVNIASKPGATTNNFPGTLDEISLYPTALSAGRVQAHFSQGLASATYGSGVYGSSLYS